MAIHPDQVKSIAASFVVQYYNTLSSSPLDLLKHYSDSDDLHISHDGLIHRGSLSKIPSTEDILKLFQSKSVACRSQIIQVKNMSASSSEDSNRIRITVDGCFAGEKTNDFYQEFELIPIISSSCYAIIVDILGRVEEDVAKAKKIKLMDSSNNGLQTVEKSSTHQPPTTGKEADECQDKAPASFAEALKMKKAVSSSPSTVHVESSEKSSLKQVNTADSKATHTVKKPLSGSQKNERQSKDEKSKREKIDPKKKEKK